MRRACGGIVIDLAGRVLLRKPAAQHKGRVWTFAKGKPLPGESPEQTAVREVLEETGVLGRILGPVQVDATVPDADLYYLMAPLEEKNQHDSETEAVVWATRDEAEELLGMTSDDTRRLRDLRLLHAAFVLYQAKGFRGAASP